MLFAQFVSNIISNKQHFCTVILAQSQVCRCSSSNNKYIARKSGKTRVNNGEYVAFSGWFALSKSSTKGKIWSYIQSMTRARVSCLCYSSVLNYGAIIGITKILNYQNFR